MTFIQHKNGNTERVLPKHGETVKITTKEGIIVVESDLTKKNQVYEREYRN